MNNCQDTGSPILAVCLTAKDILPFVHQKQTNCSGFTMDCHMGIQTLEMMLS